MARIPYSDMTGLAQELVEELDKRHNTNLYRMLANGGSASLGYLRMGAEMRYNAMIAPAVRELVILRTGSLCRSAYELHYHKILADKYEVGDQKMQAAIEEGSSAEIFDIFETALLRFTEEVVLDGKASEAAFKALAEHFDAEQLIEVTFLIGFYMMTSRFLQTFDIGVQDD